MKKAMWAFWVICFSLVIMVIAGCSDDDDPVLDRTPEAFSFTSQNGVPLTTLITSDSITIAGLSATATAPISVSADSAYSINGGAYVTTAGTVVNGDTVTVQHTSAATEATATVTTLTIGGVIGTFTSTTATTTFLFSFTSQTGVPLATLITSDTITISGLTAPAAISVTAGSTYSIDGGAFTDVAGTIDNNQTVAVQHTSAATEATATVTTLTIGGVTGTFTSTTATAFTFSFTSQTGVALATLITSETITIAGLTAPAAISVSAGSTYSIDGGVFTDVAGMIDNGQTVAVQHTSAATEATDTVTTLTIDGVTGTFTSTTATTAFSFSFTPQTGVAPATLITSETITIAGLTAPAAISVSPGSTYSIDGGAFTDVAGMIDNGQTVAVQHTSAATEATDTVTTLTIDGVTGTFTSTTATTAFTFSFTPQTGVAPATLITSETITIAGLTAPAAISVSAGSTYSIDGGAFTDVAGMIDNGQTVAVQHTSAATEATDTVTTLTISGVSGTFTSTTLASAAGQLVYDANCAGCHMLGTYDTAGNFGDLAGAGAQLSDADRYPTPDVAGHQGITLSATQIADLATFLDTF